MNTDVDESVTDQNQPAKRSGTEKPMRRWIIRLLLYPTLIYLGIVGFLALNETYLVYPGSSYPKGNWNPTNFEFKEVQFQSIDGTKLVGWFLPGPFIKPQPDVAQGSGIEIEAGIDTTPTILLCHGNAENVAQASAYYGDNFRQLFKANVFVFDYRGYGKSEGTPNERGVSEDAESALNWVCEQTKCKPQDVILVGHSLGGGPAVHLAAKFNCRALILQRTFSSLPDVAQNQYPWIPVKMIMRNRFASSETIKGYKGPLFQSHGRADKLIPIKFAKKTFNAAPSDDKRFFEVEGMTHWDPLPPEYWTEVKEFIDSVD